MSQEELKSCVLLLNLPQNALCGIDLLSFTASPRFLGVKNLPQGWHFVFTSPTHSFSIRHGAWFYVKDSTVQDPSRAVIIKKWDAAVEEFVAEVEESELLRWRANIGSIWKDSLTPYRQSATTATGADEDGVVEEPHDWPLLSDCLSPSLVSRICGSQKEDGWTLTSASSAAEDFDDIPGLSSAENHLDKDKELHFISIDLKRTWREGAIGRERTDAAKDRSWALINIIESQCSDPAEIIGEMQFTFLTTLVLNNNSCFEQWKRIISLLLTCKEAAAQQPSFFVKFLGVLKLQLGHNQDIEGGLFDMSDENGSLLKTLLVRFRSGIEEMGESVARQQIMDALGDLESFLNQEYGWLLNESYVRSGMVDLEDGERVPMDMSIVDEDDEYAPTMADVSPELMKEWRAQQGKETRLEQVVVEEPESDDEMVENGIKQDINPNGLTSDRIEDRIVELDDEGEDQEMSLDQDDMDARPIYATSQVQLGVFWEGTESKSKQGAAWEGTTQSKSG